MPLDPEQARALLEVCQPAPFGRGEDTLVDPNVRKTSQLDPTKITFTILTVLSRQCPYCAKHGALTTTDQLTCAALESKSRLYPSQCCYARLPEPIEESCWLV